MKALPYLGASTPIPQASRGLPLITFLKEYENSYHWAPILFHEHISARVLTGTWAEGEASNIQAGASARETKKSSTSQIRQAKPKRREPTKRPDKCLVRRGASALRFLSVSPPPFLTWIDKRTVDPHRNG